MAFQFLPSVPEQLEELGDFLAGAFQMPRNAPFLDPELMKWKYFAPHPQWTGPRSFVLRQGERVAAHGCAHPVTFLTPGRPVTSTRVIDWAADAAVPGAGAVLFRKFGTLAETLLAVGGSDETRRILPKLGMQRVGELSLYARPVRPVRQAMRRGGAGWRAAARLARNAVWSRARLASVSERFRAVRVERFERVPVPVPAADRTVACRTPELLNFLLACPGAEFSGFVIEVAGATGGYFVLSRSGSQTRIADLWVEGPAENWTTAVSLAAREAMQDPETCEVTAVGSIERMRQAIEANGFQPRGADPIFLCDPKRMLAGAPPLHLQLLDGDECYLNNPAYPFWT